MAKRSTLILPRASLFLQVRITLRVKSLYARGTCTNQGVSEPNSGDATRIAVLPVYRMALSSLKRSRSAPISSARVSPEYMLDNVGLRYPVDEYGIHIIKGSRRPPGFSVEEWKRLTTSRNDGLLRDRESMLQEQYHHRLEPQATGALSSVDVQNNSTLNNLLVVVPRGEFVV